MHSISQRIDEHNLGSRHPQNRRQCRVSLRKGEPTPKKLRQFHRQNKINVSRRFILGRIKTPYRNQEMGQLQVYHKRSTRRTNSLRRTGTESEEIKIQTTNRPVSLDNT